MVTSFERIELAKENVISTLKDKGVQERYLNFGGIGDQPAKRPTAPTDARSEFLANRAMGDWAENVLSKALTEQLQG